MARIDITFNIDRQTISRTDKNVINSGNKNYIYAVFTTSQEWDEFLPEVVFTKGTRSLVMPLNKVETEDKNYLECEIPKVFMSQPGLFYIGLCAGDTLLTNMIHVKVNESCTGNGEDLSDLDAVIEKIADIEENVKKLLEDNVTRGITYLNSPDEQGNYVRLREIESGTYILNGKFISYTTEDGTNQTLSFSYGFPVIIGKTTDKTYLQCIYPPNNTIQYAVITDNSFERGDKRLRYVPEVTSKGTPGQLPVINRIDDEGYPVEWKLIDCPVGSISDSGEPKTYTKGIVGQIYMDTDTGDMYKCTNAVETEDSLRYTWEKLGGNGAVKRIESMDENNLVDFRSLDTGVYILYGYFKPFPNSDATLSIDNRLVTVEKQDVGSNILIFNTLNGKIRFYEVLVDDTAEHGHTYTTSVFTLLDIDKAVRFDKSQELTEEQQEQARANIGGVVTKTMMTEAFADHNEDETAHADIRDAINTLNNNPPARIANVVLDANKWNGSGNLYSQIVTIEGVTETSQVDLTPSVEQLVVFYEKDLTLVTENEDGVVTVYAIGQKPVNDYVIQATITEVNIDE